MTKYKNEMKFHMLMFMNAWMMLVLMKCRCQMQCLTQSCYDSGFVCSLALTLDQAGIEVGSATEWARRCLSQAQIPTVAMDVTSEDCSAKAGSTW